MSTLLPWAVLAVSVLAAHAGAERLAAPLAKLRAGWGLSPVAGASFVALATASPEIGTNTASALLGAPDIGLGNLLGANIVSVPIIVTVAYLANRPRTEKPLLPLAPEANYLQAYPYLAIVALVALLTVPAPWRGLQPIDGWLVLAAYGAYLAQAMLRCRRKRETVHWSGTELFAAARGVLLLAGGAWATIRATEHIVADLGISAIAGGLFITATMSVLPEAFATWALVKSGQVAPATTSVVADNLATLTLAFFPLAMVGVPIQDPALFFTNLGFVALFGAVYAGFVRFGRGGAGFEGKEVGLLVGVYAVYLAVMLLLFTGG